MVLDEELLQVTRGRIYEALQAEGVPIGKSYQNLHLLPMYQQKMAYGTKGFPWTSEICKRDVDYRKGICPVAEKLQDNSYLSIGMCVYDFSSEDIDRIVTAFNKVWGRMSSLVDK